MTFWEYPEHLEKSSTSTISVYRNKVNGALILHDANDFANKQVYMGYGIQEAKRMFKLHLKDTMTNILIANIQKLFRDKWEYFELGSSQTDLIEAHIIKTIKDTLKGIQ